MAELLPGEKSHQKMLKPPQGFYTLWDVAKFLRTRTECVRRHCKSLGIALGPFERNEYAVTKTYKNQWRWLTEQEASKIISRHRQLQGRKD